MKSKDRVPAGYREGTRDWEDQYNMLLDDGVTCKECVRGEWCYTTYDSAGDELHQCSHCNKFSHEKSCYCPNCGAKMDKEGET